MTVRITPALVEATYNMLRETDPFKGWHLPDPDDIEIIIFRHKKTYADYEYAKGRHILRVSEAKHGRLDTLLATVAHEMIHMRQEITGEEKSAHGRLFNRHADRICRIHQWDRKTF